MQGTIMHRVVARRLRRSNIVLLLPVCTLDVRSTDGNDRPQLDRGVAGVIRLLLPGRARRAVFGGFWGICGHSA